MTQTTAQPAALDVETADRMVIKGGTLVDPGSSVHEALDLLVEDGTVRAIGPEIDPDSAAAVVDASGLLVVPGLIDLRCHLREPGAGNSETIESGTRAAAAGGFTSICAMPGTSPVCDSPVAVRYVIDRASQTGAVRVLPIAAITRGQDGEHLTDLAALQRAGAVAVGDSMHAVRDAQVMRRAMQYARNLGLTILVHAEDPDLSGNGLMHEGRTSIRLGLKGIPRSAEATIVARDALLALETGARVHFCHLSNAASVQVLRFYRERGAHITADVTPHHLLLTDAAVAGDGPQRHRYDTNAKVKPPLCEEADRAALLDALEDGTIDCIASDHAPHYPASKDTLFDSAPFGVIGFESALPALITEFVRSRRWSIDQLVGWLTVGPARVLSRMAGSLSIGSPADVALLDLGERILFDESSLRSRSRNCPWLGQEMSGRVVGTLYRGRPAHAHRGAFPQGLTGARAG